MLNIFIGREHYDDFVLDSRVTFRQNKKPEWFEDDFVKRFLKEVDNTEVLFEEALKDYKGRGISPEMISTGCKTLCCAYFLDGPIYGTLMGDNCVPFLMEIAKKKDITMMIEHFMEIPDKYFKELKISVQGKPCDSEDEYADRYCEWVDEDYEDN